MVWSLMVTTIAVHETSGEPNQKEWHYHFVNREILIYIYIYKIFSLYLYVYFHKYNILLKDSKSEALWVTWQDSEIMTSIIDIL